MKVAVGVSPRNAASYDDAVEQALREASAQKAVVAIGSCGLADPADEAQSRAFSHQIALANELDMPLVVEAPGAFDAAFSLLKQHGLPQAGVLLRAQGASADELRPWIGEGCYIAFDVRVADDPLGACELAKSVPVDRLLVESGAPDTATGILAGHPARADQVVFAADVLLSLCPAAQLMDNFTSLFGF